MPASLIKALHSGKRVKSMHLLAPPDSLAAAQKDDTGWGEQSVPPLVNN